MPLIDIVLIALMSFAVLLLIILLSSYFGYKTRKKLENKKTGETENFSGDLSLEDDRENQEPEGSDVSPAADIYGAEKFKVFNPGLTKNSQNKPASSKMHTPHTLYLKK